MQDKINNINNVLIGYFGIPKRSKKNPDPVDMLIGTILSQNTNDNNSYKAYQNLKQTFRSWEEVATQNVRKIEKVIRVAGLAKQKSRSIKNILKELQVRKDEISLAYLKKLDDRSVIDELTGFRGVGVKTAACVLLFSMNRNVCPVDTHVHRTLNRIGLVSTKSPDKTFYNIFGIIPEGAAHTFHTNLIRLGREVCKAQNPSCSICPLLTVCKYESKIFNDSVQQKVNSFMLLDNIN